MILDSAYAHTLLSHARDLYDFAVEYQGDYSDSITNARDFYRWEDRFPCNQQLVESSIVVVVVVVVVEVVVVVVVVVVVLVVVVEVVVKPNINPVSGS